MKKYIVKLVTNTQGEDGSTVSVYTSNEGESDMDFNERVKTAYHNTCASSHNAKDMLYAVVQIQAEDGNPLEKDITDHRPTPEPPTPEPEVTVGSE